MAQLNSTYEFPLRRTLVDSALWAMFWGVLIAALTVFGAQAAAFVFVAAQGWFLGTETILGQAVLARLLLIIAS